MSSFHFAEPNLDFWNVIFRHSSSDLKRQAHLRCLHNTLSVTTGSLAVLNGITVWILHLPMRGPQTPKAHSIPTTNL